MSEIICRRIDEQTPSEDGEVGERVLVDRVWLKGLRRQGAPLDEWLREVAPSIELQRWYGRHRQRFGEFRRRYLTDWAINGTNTQLPGFGTWPNTADSPC